MSSLQKPNVATIDTKSFVERLAEFIVRQGMRLAKGTLYLPELSNIRSENIGEGCTIHSHVWIGDEVVIGNRVKIQAFSFIPNLVTIEDDVFIGPHVCFTNDKRPPSPNWSPTLVKKGASIGANATIICGVTIGENATVGAGSVVTKDVPPNETVVGNPACVLRPRSHNGHRPVVLGRVL